MSDKLHIPGPDQFNPRLYEDDIFYTGVVCLAIALTGWWFASSRGADDAAVAPPTTATRTTESPKAPDTTPDAAVTTPEERKLAKLNALSASELGRYRWNKASLLLALSRGGGPVSDAACQVVAPKLADASVEREVHIALLKRVTRRDADAPWGCLLEGFLAGSLSERLSVHAEVAKVWEEAAWYDDKTDALLTRATQDWIARRALPPGEPVKRWLRVCALHMRYRASKGCRALLYQRSPELGADLVDIAERHVRSGDIEPERDLPIMAEGLGYVGRFGPAKTWPPPKAKEAPAFALALRRGAVYTLCRWATAPSSNIASAAASALSRVAEVGARGHDAKLLQRWRIACQRLFDPVERANDERVPLLSVRRPDRSVAYPIAAALERGDCQLPQANLPAWRCGAQAWQQDKAETPLEVHVRTIFIDTRYVEW